MRTLEHALTGSDFTLEMLFKRAFKCEYVPITNKKISGDESAF